MTRPMSIRKYDVPVVNAASSLAELERICEIRPNAVVVELRIHRDRDGQPVLARVRAFEPLVEVPAEQSDAIWKERAAVKSDDPVPLLEMKRVPVYAPGSLRARLAAKHRKEHYRS